MIKKVCITTKDCDSGICYKQAYWKSPTILVIKVTQKLSWNSFYELALGSEYGGCRLKGINGKELPLVEWDFKTVKRPKKKKK